jgi:hypothetical protein
VIKQNRTTEIEGTVSARHSQINVVRDHEKFCNCISFSRRHCSRGYIEVISWGREVIRRGSQCRICARDAPKLEFPATSELEFSGTVTVIRLLSIAVTSKLYVLRPIPVKLGELPPEITTVEQLNPKTASVNCTTKGRVVSFVVAREVVLTSTCGLKASAIDIITLISQSLQPHKLVHPTLQPRHDKKIHLRSKIPNL